MIKLTMQDKVASTIKYAKGLIDAGWNRDEAITNSQNLWHIPDKRMIEVGNAIPIK